MYTLPNGVVLNSLTDDINSVCHAGGPFRHTIEYQLERYQNPDERARARFKISQMTTFYVDKLMTQFPEMQAIISHATLAMQLKEILLKTPHEEDL